MSENMKNHELTDDFLDNVTGGTQESDLVSRSSDRYKDTKAIYDGQSRTSKSLVHNKKKDTKVAKSGLISGDVSNKSGFC